MRTMRKSRDATEEGKRSSVSAENTAAITEIADEDAELVGNTMSPTEINELIEAHVPLVKHIVFQVAVHFPRHVEREELARAGALGLVEAAQRYSPDRGIPFQRFAARRVRGAMLDAVRAADWAPRSVRRLSRRFDAMEQQLASELGRAPRTSETAEALGMKPAEVSKLRSQLYRSVVLALEHDVDGENGEELNLLDVLPDRANLEPDEQLEGRELYAYLQDAISLLPERHRLVIVGYFLEEKTSVELARFLGVTESRVSQLRSDAIEMLRTGIQSQYEDAPAEPETGRRAERRKAYANAIGDASNWRDRLDEGAELSTRIRSVL